MSLLERTGGSPAPEPRTPGELGIWVFVLGDMLVFAACFAVLAVTRAHDPAGYAAGTAALHLGIGLANTLLLLSSSLSLALGVDAARAGNTDRAVRSVALTMAGAVVFVALKVTEYVLLTGEGLTPRTSDFFLYYYCFTGLHLLHVTIGLVVLGGVLRLVRRPRPTVLDRSLLESGAIYWHMVDLLWIVLFALLYLTG